MGAFTWGVVSVAAWVEFGKFGEIRDESAFFSFEVYCLVLAPLHLLLISLGTEFRGLLSIELKLLSGVVLHAIFWTVLLTYWRIRSVTLRLTTSKKRHKNLAQQRT